MGWNMLTSRKSNAGKAGFTLAEVLVAVLIMSVLVTMAVPMYERAIEKSRIAEVSVALKRLGEAKLRTMDDQNITNFNNSFAIADLDIEHPSSSEFIYSLNPTIYKNSVCAARAKGVNQGTYFLYMGEEGADYCNCSGSLIAGSVCDGYCNEGVHFFCDNGITTNGCEAYGKTHYDIGGCPIGFIAGGGLIGG